MPENETFSKFLLWPIRTDGHLSDLNDFFCFEYSLSPATKELCSFHLRLRLPSQFSKSSFFSYRRAMHSIRNHAARRMVRGVHCARLSFPMVLLLPVRECSVSPYFSLALAPRNRYKRNAPHSLACDTYSFSLSHSTHSLYIFFLFFRCSCFTPGVNCFVHWFDFNSSASEHLFRH